jgi:uncharacterized protein (TIGR03435 family)
MLRIVLILVAISGAAVVSAQDTAPPELPSFEVASVRQNTSGDARSMMAWPKGSLAATNMLLRMLIAHAYEVPLQLMRFMLVGGPEDLLTEHYDIQARTPEHAPEGQHFAMLRSLLAGRFKLRVRHDIRPMPVYALTLAREDRRLGAELRASAIDCTAERERARQAGQPFTPATAPRDAKGRPVCWGTFESGTPGAQTIRGVGPLSDLVRGLQAVVDRPISDATGLDGIFEWHVLFASGANPNPDVPSVFTAVEEQLGLKLQAQTAPFEVLVIESVERPTPD